MISASKKPITNGGFSTFYSKNLSPQQVVDAINEAYSNCELKLGTRNTYQGVANNGMKIDMFLDQSGKIISALTGGKRMNGIIVEGNTLTIGHTKIIVKYPIKKIEKINGKYIVLLKIPRVELEVDELNNILCYDEQGIMCWQISNKLPSNIVSKEQIPYIAIQVIDGKLYATDFWGRKFNVDTENGELIDVKIVH